ncbi:YhcN/YlaJ family sporulation lipoprotein [Bacillus sp. 2205SS5-2]|uniref:YhcN/YlaJ family sporulation lipoprotein n=1 Tax=Bacillus sp. 2205SS5-2 TaxID=3109031 RepID=UPI0030061DB3
MRKTAKVLMIIYMLGMVSGCEEKESFDDHKSNTALIKIINPSPVNLSDNKQGISTAQKVKDEVEKIEDLYDVAIIEGDETILVAYKVKHLKRFTMKKIEKKLNKMLESQFSQEEFIVSSDYKIFLEAVRLKEDMKDGELSKKEANDRFEEILDLTEKLA